MTRDYRWNGRRVTEAEFGRAVSDLLAKGWRLVAPTTPPVSRESAGEETDRG